MGFKLSEWTMYDHCSFRYIEGTDPNKIENRVAFIEKTPRVRVKPFEIKDDWKGWMQGPKGHDPELGKYQPSRDWCDAELIKMGYIIP